MTSYGSVNAANFTSKERTVTIRTTIGVPDLVFLPSQRNSTNNGLTVVDPMHDGVDRRCQWVPFGPLYKSGYCRNITVSFRAKLAAGVVKASRSDDIPHNYYGGSYAAAGTARSFSLTDGSNTATEFAYHSAVSGMFTATTFKLELSLIEKSTGRIIPMACSMNLLSGNFGEDYNPSSGVLTNARVSLPATAFEADSSGFAECSHASVRSRIYPEYQGGSASTCSSFYQELYYRATTNDRQVDIWYSFGNSFTTKDPGFTSAPWPPSMPRYVDTEQKISGDVKLTVTGPRVLGTWENSMVKSYTETYDAVSNSYTTVIVFMSTSDAAFGAYPDLSDGWALPVFRATLFYRTGSLTTDETNTRDALIEGQINGNAWVTPVFASWPSVEATYGPWGAIPARPGNGNIPSNSWITNDATAFASAGKIANDDYNYYTGSRAWYVQQKYGFATYGGNAGGFPVFHQKGWVLGRSGFPDMRGKIRDAYGTLNRPRNFKEEDGTTINPYNYRSKSQLNTSPKAISDLMFWSGRPHILSNGEVQPYPDRATGLGKRAPRGPSIVSALRSNLSNYNPSWSPHDAEHWIEDDVIFATLLSSDIGLQYMVVPHLVVGALAMKPIRDGVWTARTQGFTRQNSAVIGYTNSALCYGLPRSEARCSVATPIGLYWITGDQRILRKLLLRKTTLWQGAIPYEDYPNLYNQANWQSTETGWMYEHGMGTHALGDAFSGSPLSGHNCYNPWQALILPQYLYALVRALNLCYTDDLDMTDVNAVGEERPIDNHAFELKVMLYYLCKAYAFNGFCYSSSTNFKYIPFAVIDWTWQGRDANNRAINPGAALPAAIKNLPADASGHSPINPTTGLPYWLIGAGWHFVWTVNAIIIGWELASEFGDTETMAQCATLLNSAAGGYDFSLATQDTWGWGNGINENVVEVCAVISDPFKSRTTPYINLATITIQGNTTVNGNDLTLDIIDLTATINGSTTVDGGNLDFTEGYIDFVHTLDGMYTHVTLNEISVVDVEWTELAIETTTINCSTIVQPTGDDPELVGTSNTVLPTTTMAGTTTISSRLAIITNILSAETYYLSGIMETYKSIKVAVKFPMPAKNQTFELVQGNDALLKITLTAILDTDALDLTAISGITWKLYSAGNRDNVWIIKTLDNGITVTESDMFEITIDNVDTLTLRDLYEHECFINYGGKIYTLFTGRCRIIPSVSA